MLSKWIMNNRVCHPSYALSWLIALAMILAFNEIVPIDIPFFLHCIIPLGPLLLALIVSRVTDNPEEL